MANSNYESPYAEVVSLVFEGVLCASVDDGSGTDMNPETGNM